MPPAPPTAGAPVPAAAVPAPTGDWIEANEQLKVQGIPPIPAGLAGEVARYGDFRGHGFVDWHPGRREMLVSHRKAGASTVQIHRLASPLGELEQLTDFADPVGRASYEPLGGDSIVFERSSGGNEAAQIYRLDLATRQVTVLSEPDMRHGIGGWLHLSSRLLYSSVPLDRTASGGRRAEIVQARTGFEMLDKDSAYAAGAGDRRDGRDGEANKAASWNNVEECRRRHCTKPGRHGPAHQSDHDRTRAITLERNAVEIAQPLYHPHDDGRDTGDIRNRHGDDSAYCRIGRMAFYDGIGLRSSPRRIDPCSYRGHTHERSRRGW